MSLIMRLQGARVRLPCACRSQSISQSVQASLAEIKHGKQQQSATPVEVFLEELRSAVDSLQSSKVRASDVVSKLEQLPGRLLSSAVDCSAVRREAEWLAYLTSSTLLPGALGSYEQVQQCHILMQRLLSLTRRQHALRVTYRETLQIMQISAVAAQGSQSQSSLNCRKIEFCHFGCRQMLSLIHI